MLPFDRRTSARDMPNDSENGFRGSVTFLDISTHVARHHSRLLWRCIAYDYRYIRICFLLWQGCTTSVFAHSHPPLPCKSAHSNTSTCGPFLYNSCSCTSCSFCAVAACSARMAVASKICSMLKVGSIFCVVSLLSRSSTPGTLRVHTTIAAIDFVST